MHYKNGTPARNGDAVVMRRYNGEIISGVLHSLQPAATSCNGIVASVIPGGAQQDSVTVGEIYSAADAWAAMEKQKVES